MNSSVRHFVEQECFAGLREPTASSLDCLKCARILSRDEASLSQLCLDDLLDCLVEYAFGEDWEKQQTLTIEALKTLSNVIYKRSVVINRLRADVAAKGQSIIHSLTLLLESFREIDLSSQHVTYISEVLKTAYNVAYAIQRSNSPPEIDADVFNRMTRILRDFLTIRCAPESLKIQLQRHTVHVLNVLPSHSLLELMYPTNGPGTQGPPPMQAISELVGFLDKQLDLVDEPSSLISEFLCPILNLLTRGSQTNREIRKYCRKKVLPNLAEDVERLPEEGQTLRNRPFQEVNESVAIFIFVLCKENIARAVKYTGFGNFSGFLARHALLGRPSRASDRATSSVTDTTGYSSTSSDSETEVYQQLKDNVNPVTGRWELAQPNPMDDMTEEQKEYLAMQLVNDIDRLQRKGIIQPSTLEGGRVRPVEHVTELLKDVKVENQHTGDNDHDSDA